MDNKGFNKVFGVVTAVILIGAAFYGYMYLNKPEVPVPAEDGTVKGVYTIDGIMALGKNYECRFDRSEGDSSINGVLYTDGSNLKGEFRIVAPSLPQKEFSSFLIVKSGVSYAWTSLAPVGYKGSPAKSASINASPEEQSQIVGGKDKLEYDCKPVTNLDSTTFDPPSWITFSELK